MVNVFQMYSVYICIVENKYPLKSKLKTIEQIKLLKLCGVDVIHTYSHHLETTVELSKTINKIETVESLCYAQIYLPAFCKVSSNLVHLFLQEKRTKIRSKALSIDIKAYKQTEMEIRPTSDSLVNET